MLGLRQTPGRLALAVFRMPLRLYEHGRGWVLGRSFLVVTHLGRKTGRAFNTAVMVLSYDRETQESIVCSAWGADSDWVRNIRARPATKVHVGRDRYTPQQRFLTDGEAFTTAVDFRQEHPWRLRLLSSILGWGDLRIDDTARDFISTRPFIAFRPAPEQTS
jgi:deazaflavin-dependent oxidoreductase (nitroreductase family)